MNFGEILKSLLTDNNITQAELAQKIGYTQKAVSKWVCGQSEPTETAIKNVADFFELPADYLLGRTDDGGNVVISKIPPTVPALSANEQKLLKNFRAMRPDLQAYYLKMSETLIQTPDEIAGNNQKKKA